MSETHNVVLVKDHRNKKYGFLKLRTIQNRKASDKTLGIKIQIKNWNAEKQVVYSKEPQSDQINEKIQEVLLHARGGTAEYYNLGKKSKSFLNFAPKVVDVIPARNTKRGKNDGLNKIREYLKTLIKRT